MLGSDSQGPAAVAGVPSVGLHGSTDRLCRGTDRSRQAASSPLIDVAGSLHLVQTASCMDSVFSGDPNFLQLH